MKSERLADLSIFAATSDAISFTSSPGKRSVPAGITAVSFDLQLKPGPSGTFSAQFDDGKSAPQDLVCEKRWALSNLFNAIEQSQSYATAFPSKPGTVDDLNPGLCDQSNLPALRDLQGRYSKLVQSLPNSNGFGLGTLTADQHPLKRRCYYLKIFLKADGGDIASAKAIVGDSLEGVFVQYQLIGVISAQGQTAKVPLPKPQ
jgi:hypothetical protein